METRLNEPHQCLGCNTQVNPYVIERIGKSDLGMTLESKGETTVVDSCLRVECPNCEFRWTILHAKNPS